MKPNAKNFFTALAVVLISCASLQGAPINKYGMRLGESNGKMCVPDSLAFDRIGIDWKSLPDVLTPFKPEVRVFDAKSIESIIPDTLIYKTNAAGHKLPLLVYRSNVKGAPVVFHIHGGGWKSGSYTAAAALCKTLAGKYGITVVSIEYTFATVPGAKLEDTMEDCYDGVEYILSRAEEFKIDPQSIGFMGGSAGGHLSACCAMHFPQTKALAGWYGAYDLIHTMNVYAPAFNAKKHGIYTTFLKNFDEKYMKQCSPYVVARNCKTNFKAILFEGTADITIGPGNAEKFRKSLNEAGNDNVEVHLFKNITHTMFSSYVAEEIYISTINLFVSQL